MLPPSRKLGYRRWPGPDDHNPLSAESSGIFNAIERTGEHPAERDRSSHGEPIALDDEGR